MITERTCQPPRKEFSTLGKRKHRHFGLAPNPLGLGARSMGDGGDNPEPPATN